MLMETQDFPRLSRLGRWGTVGMLLSAFLTTGCVSHEARGKRLGFRLLESSLHHLQRLGCRRASLSVTTWNREAMALYTGMGFERKRAFTATVWEGFS